MGSEEWPMKLQINESAPIRWHDGRLSHHRDWEVPVTEHDWHLLLKSTQVQHLPRYCEGKFRDTWDIKEAPFEGMRNFKISLEWHRTERPKLSFLVTCSVTSAMSKYSRYALMQSHKCDLQWCDGASLIERLVWVGEAKSATKMLISLFSCS